jgi:hypothetical protein
MLKVGTKLDRDYPRWHENITENTALRFEAIAGDRGIALRFHINPPQDKDGLDPVLNCYNFPAQAFQGDIIHEADSLQSKENCNGLMLARRWLENCRHAHPSCTTSREVNFMPPRILDLSNAHVRLVEDTESMTSCNYVALSHCWVQFPPHTN